MVSTSLDRDPARIRQRPSQRKRTCNRHALVAIAIALILPTACHCVVVKKKASSSSSSSTVHTSIKGAGILKKLNTRIQSVARFTQHAGEEPSPIDVLLKQKMGPDAGKKTKKTYNNNKSDAFPGGGDINGKTSPLSARLDNTITEDSGNRIYQEQEFPEPEPRNPPRAPHIVVVMVDDLGWSDASFNAASSHTIPTPHLESLASSGAVLKQHITYPVCTPSRAAFLTGRSPSQFGLNHLLRPWDTVGIPPEIETLPEQLQAKGNYSTHLIGKWHLGFSRKAYLPTEQGFDSFFGYLTGSQDYYSHITGGARFMGTHHSTLRFEGPSPRSMGIHAEDFGQWRSWKGLDFWRNQNTSWEFVVGDDSEKRLLYSTHLYAREAEDVIDTHAKRHCLEAGAPGEEDEDRCSKPLFLMTTLQAPHAPIEVPSFYSDLARELIPSPPQAILDSVPLSVGGEANRWYRYAGMIMCMDEAIGNITAALKRNDLYEDTMVIFVGDNGAPAGETHISRLSNAPLKAGKASLFEGGTRTPAIVAGGKWVAEMMKEPLQLQQKKTEDKVKGHVGKDDAVQNKKNQKSSRARRSDGGIDDDNSLHSSPFRFSTRLIHIADWCPTILEMVERMADASKRNQSQIEAQAEATRAAAAAAATPSSNSRRRTIEDDGSGSDSDGDLFGGESFLDSKERNASITLLIRHQNYARGAARRSRWKLLADFSLDSDSQKWQVLSSSLYDLREDPREESPIIFKADNRDNQASSWLSTLHSTLLHELSAHFYRDYATLDGGPTQDHSDRVFTRANPLLTTVPSPLFNVTPPSPSPSSSSSSPPPPLLGVPLSSPDSPKKSRFRKAGGPFHDLDARPNDDKRYLTGGYSERRDSVLVYSGWPAKQPIWAPWLTRNDRTNTGDGGEVIVF